MTIQT